MNIDKSVRIKIPKITSPISIACIIFHKMSMLDDDDECSPYTAVPISNGKHGKCNLHRHFTNVYKDFKRNVVDFVHMVHHVPLENNWSYVISFIYSRLTTDTFFVSLRIDVRLQATV